MDKYTKAEITQLTDSQFWKIDLREIGPEVDLGEAASKLVPLIAFKQGIDKQVIVLLVTYSATSLAYYHPEFKPDKDDIVRAKGELKELIEAYPDTDYRWLPETEVDKIEIDQVGLSFWRTIKVRLVKYALLDQIDRIAAGSGLTLAGDD